MNNRTIKLKYPLKFMNGEGKEKVVDTLVFCDRIKIKHLKALPASVYEKEEDDKMSISEIMPLIGALCDLPESAIDELDAVDLEEVSKLLPDFLKELQAVGGK